MKFNVRRVSLYEGKPCAEAYQDTYTYVDRRSTDDPKKIPAYVGLSTDWWYKEGKNHRIIDGEIARDFPDSEAWFVDINSLEELLVFQKKYGSLVIENFYRNSEILSIEICDDYRE